jgi:hypothetical protein
MPKLGEGHYRIVFLALVAFWLFLVARQQTCDVWDETDLLLNNLAAPGTGELLAYLWTHPIHFYRPLGSSVVAIVSRAFEYDVAWRLLRFLNAGLLLSSLFLLLAVIRKWSGTDRVRDLLVTVLFLFSGSAMIATGWFPVIFDVGVLFFLSAALLALVYERPIIAGFLLGVAFFFKETAAMAVPLLLGLWLMGRINSKAFATTLMILAAIGGLYWVQRHTLIPLGSEQDLHGFEFGKLIPTAWGWMQSFWYQSVSHLGLPHMGAAWLLISLALFKQRRALVTALLLVIPPVLLYWGMFGLYRSEVLITASHFQGRFYLVPAALLLLWLATWGRRPALLILLFPVLLGAFHTYRDHLRFQDCYSQIYSLRGRGPVTVHYPEKPLDDWMRVLRIGNFPEADYRLEAKTGVLVRAAEGGPVETRKRSQDGGLE